MLSVYLMCCKGCPRQPHGIDFKKKLLGASSVWDVRNKFHPLPTASPKSFSDQDIFWLYNDIFLYTSHVRHNFLRINTRSGFTQVQNCLFSTCPFPYPLLQAILGEIFIEFNRIAPIKTCLAKTCLLYTSPSPRD